MHIHIKTIVIKTIVILSVFIAAGTALFPVQAVSGASVSITPPGEAAFTGYWYPNGAEISRFALKQSRYGEIHEGDAVMIFVTEPFNPRLQVKADRSGAETVPILKLNSTRKFYTGIYPYSVMTSVFAPVNAESHPLPLKISFSAQEWCGHVYGQMNLRDGRYEVAEHSYFEKEADREYAVDGVLSEDALWTRIRIAPQRLPTGDFRMIPGMLHSRFAHQALAVEEASAVLEEAGRKSAEGRPLAAYTVRFQESGRVLAIFFEREFPHRIDGFRDTYQVAAHFGGRELTTEAQRTHLMMTDYWNHHGNADRQLLPELGLAAE